MDMTSTKRKVLTGLGVAITLAFLALLGFCVYASMSNPGDTTLMVSMGLVSSGLMSFLVIFALFYGGTRSPSEEYSEMYLGICGGCGSKLDQSGTCPVCGRVGHRPKI